MSRRARLAWGLVGALSFLVLVQAYELAVGVRVDVGVKAAVAVAVGLATLGLIRVAARRVGANESA